MLTVSTLPARGRGGYKLFLVKKIIIFWQKHFRKCGFKGWSKIILHPLPDGGSDVRGTVDLKRVRNVFNSTHSFLDTELRGGVRQSYTPRLICGSIVRVR